MAKLTLKNLYKRYDNSGKKHKTEIGRAHV